MPRLKKPHRSEVISLPFDAGTPYAQRRAVYSRLSDDDADSVSHALQEQDALVWAARQNPPLVVVKVYRDWRTGFDPNRRAYRQLFGMPTRVSTRACSSGTHAVPRGITGAWPVVEFHRELPGYRIDGVSKPYDIENVGIWGTDERQRGAEHSPTLHHPRRERAARGQWVAGKRPYCLERECRATAVYRA